MINFISLNYNWNWIFKNIMKIYIMYIFLMVLWWFMKKGRWGGGLFIYYDNLMFEGFWFVIWFYIFWFFYERNWLEIICIIYWFRKMKWFKYIWRYNINFIELSFFGFFREINSDINSNIWIFVYKFYKNVRENVKIGIFFFKFSLLYLVCGICIDYVLI